MSSLTISSKPDIRLSNLSLCPKCDQKAREIDKIYDREIKNLQYLLNFKDMAVQKRDEMVFKYVEEINKLKETIKNLNKLVYRLKLDIPDPKNITKSPSHANGKNYNIETYENEIIPGLIMPPLNFDSRPVSSISTNNHKRMFSAKVLKKNQSIPVVKIIKNQDKKICVTGSQGLAIQQSLLSDKNRKTLVLMEEIEEKKVLKDPKLKQLEDFYMKNENYLETFTTMKSSSKTEFLENSFSVLIDFKTALAQTIKMKKIIKFFQKAIKTLNYQENFQIISKYTAEILDCEKSSFFLLDEENQELWTKFKADDPTIFRLPITKGIIGYVASNNQCIRVDDTGIDPRFNKDIDNYQKNYHLKTMLVVPVKDNEGKIIGVLEALNKINATFNTEDEEFINLISEQAYVILRNCSNFEKTVATQYKLQNLLKVQLKLFEYEKFEDFQSFIEKTLLDVTNSSSVNIYFVHQTKKILLKVKNATSFEEMPMNVGIIGEVAKTGEQISASNAQEHPLFNPVVDFKATSPIHTYPIKGAEGIIIGVLQILKFHDMLGRKPKKDPYEEDILMRMLVCLGVFYEKMRNQMTFLN